MIKKHRHQPSPFLDCLACQRLWEARLRVQEQADMENLMRATQEILEPHGVTSITWEDE